MVRGCLWGAALGSLLLFTSVAHAQCTKDTDCKGERVCDAGTCAWPAAAPTQDPNGWDVGIAAVPEEVEPSDAEQAAAKPPAASPTPAESAPPAKPGGALEMREPSADDSARPTRPKMVRRSVGVMTTGIVLVSVAPIPLLAGMIGLMDRCNVSYSTYERNCGDSGPAIGLTLAGLALIGIGAPLIVIGGKRVPAKEPWQATVLPYATPDGAGIGLRLKL